MTGVSSIFTRGSGKVLTALGLSLGLLVPFSIFALNKFIGKSDYCNDTSYTAGGNLNDCVDEFLREYTTAPSIYAPRALLKPYHKFDTFGESFYSLYLIVSQEGWTDAMAWARDSSGIWTQPKEHSSDFDAAFFVVFNFCGTLFIMTLFASVMIRNYTETTGVAYLTREQRAWTEQKRLLQRIRPSKNPLSPHEFSPLRASLFARSARRQEGGIRQLSSSSFFTSLSSASGFLRTFAGYRSRGVGI